MHKTKKEGIENQKKKKEQDQSKNQEKGCTFKPKTNVTEKIVRKGEKESDQFFREKEAYKKNIMEKR